MTDSNPYRPPDSAALDQTAVLPRREGARTSIFMILAGLFFCTASFYVLLSHGLAPLWNAYRAGESFGIWFMTFYGIMSGLTALLHFSYLLRGQPDQAKAGLYAIGIAIGLTCVAAAAMEILARR